MDTQAYYSIPKSDLRSFWFQRFAENPATTPKWWEESDKIVQTLKTIFPPNQKAGTTIYPNDLKEDADRFALTLFAIENSMNLPELNQTTKNKIRSGIIPLKNICHNGKYYTFTSANLTQQNNNF